ncbi:MAG: anti-sigma factor family protein [Gemmataceae bacterium]
MNCHDVCDRLPLHLYGDLPADEAGAVAGHLAQCAACRRELAALALVRDGLNAAPLPASVSVEPVYAAEARRQRRSARRWRLAALAGIAAAIALLLPRLDFRADDRQLTVRWGPERVTHTSTVVVKQEVVPSANFDERMARVSELIVALAGSAEAGDRERAAELAKVRQELAALRQENQRRWSETRRELDALYTAQFGSRQSGGNP